VVDEVTERRSSGATRLAAAKNVIENRRYPHEAEPAGGERSRG
jgi:hypothetical protein